MKESRHFTTARQSSCDDLHEDEVVILDSELATDGLVSDMENCLFICSSVCFFNRHFKTKSIFFPLTIQQRKDKGWPHTTCNFLLMVSMHDYYCILVWASPLQHKDKVPTESAAH